MLPCKVCQSLVFFVSFGITHLQMFLEIVKSENFDFFILEYGSSSGGLEVEQWSDNRTLSILVDQSQLGAGILFGTIGPAMLCSS